MIQATRWLFIAGAATLCGCASSVDYRQTSAMSCIELDRAAETTSRGISAASVSRGRIEKYEPPFRIVGVARAKEALVERNTRRIEKLRASQEVVLSERQGRCG